MQSLKQLVIVASLVAVPALSFAQSTTQPPDSTTGVTATAPAASMRDTPDSQRGAQSQQASHNGYRLGESSGYGTQAAGSSQSSQQLVTPFAGKDSSVFRH